MKSQNIYSINCIFLGESGVGKTSIIRRLLGKGFEEHILSNMGVEPNFFEKIKFKNKDEDDSEISVKIWDTAGQEKYRSCCEGIVRKADIIIFVRDNEIENFNKWFNFVENLIDIEVKKVIYCLNKTDLITEDEKDLIFNELEELNLEKKHNALVHCVSCKSSDGIYILKSLLRKYSQEIVSTELERHKHLIRIILIGPSGIGKSALIERIINDNFNEKSLSTIGYSKKLTKSDLKNHSEINYEYYDVSGQEKYISNWINFLDKINIIIFVNSNDKLKVDEKLIESRILLSDKKIICCVNKKDLFSDAENVKALKKYKDINQKLKDQPLFLVSAKTSYGIMELKNKINEYSINIIYKKIKNNETKSLQLEPMPKSKCC